MFHEESDPHIVLPLRCVGPSLLPQTRSFPDVRGHVCRALSRRASHVLTAVSHHPVGVVEIHAGHVLRHLKGAKRRFVSSGHSSGFLDTHDTNTHLSNVPLELLRLLHPINLLLR